LTRSVRNGRTRYKRFRREIYMFGCMLASRWIIVCVPVTHFHTHGLKRARRKTGTE